ncbi:MAG: hypothetical protein SWY16_04575 [Cyanobacteriota bacterium]|nr:hypothetical protein [Cyanobacteriota bacterium]
MIIKSSQRAGAKELALHLIKEVDIDGHEQTVRISSSRYLLADDDVRACLQDMEIMSKVAPRCQKHLYHVSVSPEQSMNEDEWETFWQTYESEFGLQNLAYIEVTHKHLNHDRPAHKHRVYERVDTTLEKAVELSHTKVRNEKIARLMEYEFGHPLTIGKHNRTIILRLTEEGREDVVLWMKAARADEVDRPVAKHDHNDYQQEKRTQVALEQVKADLQTAWQHTDTGRTFEAAIAERGYILARGDRRDFVIIDAAGGLHSPRRRLNVKAKELRQRWSDLDLAELPSVEHVQQERQGLPQIDKADPDASLRQLEQAKAKTDVEIAQLEAELQRYRISPPASVAADIVHSQEVARRHTNEPPQSADDEAKPDPTPDLSIDQRRIIAELNHWQQSADRESVKPQAADWDAVKAWGVSRDTVAMLQTYQGQQATGERERRIETAFNAKPNPKQPVLSAYLTGLKERLTQKGKRYYRTADRWLTERLAKLGYSRTQTQRVLATASPELMNNPPQQRVSYIRHLVERVYQVWEQKQNSAQEHDKTKTKPSTASKRSDTRKSQQQSGQEHPTNESKPTSPPAKSSPRPRRRKR